MNIALILASGQGSRIKTSKIPKQFIEINNKPIVGHTIDKFIINNNIDCVVVTCHPEWMDYLKKYLIDNFPNNQYHIIEGGKERNDSIANAIKYITKNISNNNNDVIITHDAVRMFVSDRIINDNISLAKKYKAIDTAIPCVDTIVSSINHKTIHHIPKRNELYHGQTPQTFHLELLKTLYLKNNIENTTDICSLLLEKTKEKIAIVIGEYENFKITTDFDLDYAIKMVKKND